MSLTLGANSERDNVPVGAIISMAAPSLPAGFLECNGATLKRAEYPALFSLIGTTYGAGDSTTTFTSPDLRGAFVRGWDNGRTVDSGRAFANTQASGSGHTHNPGAGGGAGGSTAISAAQGFPYNVAMYYIIKF